MHQPNRKPNKERIQLLVDALRSDKFRQARGALGRHLSRSSIEDVAPEDVAPEDYDTSKNRYCCLGVACEVAIANGLAVVRELKNGYVISYNDEGGALPTVVRDWYGFEFVNPVLYSEPNERTAAEINDTGATFGRIADLFEAKYLTPETEEADETAE